MKQRTWHSAQDFAWAALFLVSQVKWTMKWRNCDATSITRTTLDKHRILPLNNDQLMNNYFEFRALELCMKKYQPPKILKMQTRCRWIGGPNCLWKTPVNGNRSPDDQIWMSVEQGQGERNRRSQGFVFFIFADFHLLKSFVNWMSVQVNNWLASLRHLLLEISTLYFQVWY